MNFCMTNPIKNRFYFLILQQDLFDTWCIKKIYGGIKNNHRHETLIPYSDKQDAVQSLLTLKQIRNKRGYK